MPSLGTLFKGGGNKSKKSASSPSPASATAASTATSPASTTPSRVASSESKRNSDQSEEFPIRNPSHGRRTTSPGRQQPVVHRSQSIPVLNSSNNLFKLSDFDTLDGTSLSTKDQFPTTIDQKRRPLETGDSPYNLYGQQSKPSFTPPSVQSISAANGLAALRINTPSSFRPSTDTSSTSQTSQHDRTSSPFSSGSRVSPVSSVLSPITPISPPFSPASTAPSPITPSLPVLLSAPYDLPTPPMSNDTPSFLSLETPDTDLSVSIDFTRFESAELPMESPNKPGAPTGKKLTNHDFLFIVDDGPCDIRHWDSISDLLTSLTKRLSPNLSQPHPFPFSSNTPNDSPTSSPSPSPTPTNTSPMISVRFVNNPRNIAKLTSLSQIKNLFSHISPSRRPTTPPLRILEYYFWQLYNEKLSRNSWVGKNPTTLIMFASSPLGNRPEDLDLFVAKCADRLNTERIPLTMVSIVIVQMTVDQVLQRQLVDARRAIVSELYRPAQIRGQQVPGGVRRGNVAVGGEMKKRPQRDWVDIITCGEWDRMGMIPRVVEDEILRGMGRRREVQKEVAMNYLTTLGKENTPVTTPVTDNVISIGGIGSESPVDGSTIVGDVKRESGDVESEGRESWGEQDDFVRERGIGLGVEGNVLREKHPEFLRPPVEYAPRPGEYPAHPTEYPPRPSGPPMEYRSRPRGNSPSRNMDYPPRPHPDYLRPGYPSPPQEYPPPPRQIDHPLARPQFPPPRQDYPRPPRQRDHSPHLHPHPPRQPDYPSRSQRSERPVEYRPPIHTGHPGRVNYYD